MTSMPRSKSSSASGGVIPKPAAAFSQLAMTRSGASRLRSSGRRSFTIVRPGRQKMSPIKRIFKNQVSGLRCQVSGTTLLTLSPPKFDVITLKTGYWLLGTHFSGLQKVVIPGGIQREVVHSLRMHDHVVKKPEVDVGKVGGQDHLDVGINSLAPAGIGLRTPFFDKRVNPRIHIEAAVGAMGRKFVGVEHVLEDVWVFVAADPTQRIHLICAADDVYHERRRLKRADVEHDPHASQLLLEHGHHQARRLLRRCFHYEVKAHAVYGRVSSGIEYPARSCGIEFIFRHVALIRPTLWREDAVGGASEKPPQIMDHGPAINGVGERLPDVYVTQDRIAQVECEVAEHGSRGPLHLKVRLLLEREHHVGSQRVAGDVGAAFAKFESARGGIGHDHEAYAGHMRFIAPVVLIAFDDDFLVLLSADEAKGTRAHRMVRHFGQRAVWNNAHRAIG